MEEIIEKISKETMEELKKAKKPAYPLYYKEVFADILKEQGFLEQINPKLLCIESSVSEELLNKTTQTIKNIEKTSQSIKDESMELVEQINPIEADDIKNIIIQYSYKLIEQINSMQQKINELEGELEKAYKEILIDPLTKAYNRKAFDKDLENLLEIGKNKTLDMALAIIDLDDFKQINDTYGHLVGDFVLKKMVNIIKKLIREGDKIYRIGGDEFIVIFNRVNVKTVEKIIDRIVNTIKKTKLKYKNDLIDVSVSIGLTMYRQGDTKESIIKRADDALYESKKTKNRYFIKL